VVFGSEKVSWNLANRITVMRHANKNTALRLFFISHEAWRRGEIAHSYYYKSDPVIRDVAEHMADWGSHKPTRALPVGAWFAEAARLRGPVFVASIFSFHSIASGLASTVGGQALVGMNPGAGPSSQNRETRRTRDENLLERTHSVTVRVVLSDRP
jgi:hypothetical protein